MGCRADEAGGGLLPVWLTERLVPDLELLLDAYVAAVGRRRGELDDRLRRLTLTRLTPDERTVVLRCLDRLFPARVRPGPRPSKVRLVVFEGMAEVADRGRAVAQAAETLGTTVDEVERSLLADLPAERIVEAPAQLPCPSVLLQQANHQLVAGWLRRAQRVEISVQGSPRPILRALRTSRLICQVTAPAVGLGVRITASGPLAMHRRTVIYARAFVRFLSALGWAKEWRLAAWVPRGDELLPVVCTHRDPIFPSAPAPKRFDSKLEERFHRDFLRSAPARWELVREPRPVRAGSGWIVPDFWVRDRELRHRDAMIELVGFWTPEYLRRKLDGLRRAELGPYLLCVDESLGVEDGEIPEAALVLRYRRKVDIHRVVALLERLLPPAVATTDR